MARILLAEDDDSLRGFLARALERAGYEVARLRRRRRGAATPCPSEWDLLLTDIVMPGIDGIEVARQAAAAPAGPAHHVHHRLRRRGPVGRRAAPPGAKVLSKPIHLREIVAEVERMIAA